MNWLPQRRERGLRAPIVAVTVLEDDPVKRRHFGIDAYLAMPVSMKDLKALLDEPQFAAR